MPGSELAGFLSYAHDDDAAEHGRIARIAKDVSDQYELMTGEHLRIFLDWRDIEWGWNWRRTIDTALASVAFFIPVITPRYFRRSECRREFELFTRRAPELGVQRFVLPIRYIDFPDLHTERPSDPLIAMALTYQCEDWTELRLEARESPQYRTATTRMAATLTDVRSTSPGPAGAGPPNSTNEAADVDDILRRELRAVHEIVDDVRALVDRAGRASEAATTVWAGKGLAPRLFLLGTFADDLVPAVSVILAHVRRVNRQLAEIEPALLAILGSVAHNLRPADEHTLVEQRERRWDAVGEVAAAMSDGVSGLGDLVAALEPVENLSEGLRSGVEAVRECLAVQVDGCERVRRWLHVVEPVGPRADAAS